MSAYRAGAMLLFAALAACDDGTAPPTPSRLEVAAGDGQTGTVAAVLAVEPSVRVLSSTGETVRRASVTFTVASGSGSVERTTVQTNAQGIASPGKWTLGTKSGAQTISVTVSGVPALLLTAAARPATPRAIAVVAGNLQRGLAGSTLVTPLVVRVADQYDNPVPGIAVSFDVTVGGGTVGASSVTTGEDGTASPGTWRLGGLAGTQTVTASSSAIVGAAAVFSATADAGAPARLVFKVQPAAGAESGARLPTAPVLQIADEFGNAVALSGIVITATSANGTVRNPSAGTDATGAATFSTLALVGTVGTYTLRFTAPALAPAESSPFTLAAGAAFRLGISAGPPPSVLSGVPFSSQPRIEVQDEAGNRVTTAANAVTATVSTGPGVLSGNLTVISVQGTATFTDLIYTGGGPFQMRFTSAGLQSVETALLNVTVSTACTGPTALPLTYALGQTARFRYDSGVAPQCLQFNLAQHRDQQFLVMIENMPRTGAYHLALFPGAEVADLLTYTITAAATSGAVVSSQRHVQERERSLPPGMVSAWDFGAGEIYEYAPPEPRGGAPEPMLLRGNLRMSLNSAQVEPQVGDTITAYLVGIARLSIPDGNQRAVIRFISPDLIIAEDIRLGTLTRASGSLNTPLTQTDMDSIAKAYAAYAKVQADQLFQGRYNFAIEAQTPARVIALHTLMPSDNIWGYTYSSTNVFAWDYWVGTNGSSKGLNQHPVRNAQNLFMHEIAHMRHWGLLERTGRPDLRGNQWLVEGFARFSERLPIASYLLRSPDPSRTGNVTLPLFTEFGNSFFRDDVPTYLSMGSSMVSGYEASSFVFDYLADQVALAGGNWRSALSQFLTYAGTETELDAAVNAALPGLTFQQLFTRARLALYLDDIGTGGLPAWTQYHQVNLRASRPPVSAAPNDPRNAWPRIMPGTAYTQNRLIGPGGAYGYLIDGAAATANARITIDFVAPGNAVVSVTRIR